MDSKGVLQLRQASFASTEQREERLARRGYAFSTVNHIMSVKLGTAPLCVVVCIPVRVGSLNVPCCASSRAIYYIRYTEPVAHIGSLPLAQKCLALH